MGQNPFSASDGIGGFVLYAGIEPSVPFLIFKMPPSQMRYDVISLCKGTGRVFIMQQYPELEGYAGKGDVDVVVPCLVEGLGVFCVSVPVSHDPHLIPFRLPQTLCAGHQFPERVLPRMHDPHLGQIPREVILVKESVEIMGLGLFTLAYDQESDADLPFVHPSLFRHVPDLPPRTS